MKGALPLEKLIEMYGRLAIDRDLLAAENQHLKQAVADHNATAETAKKDKDAEIE